MDAERTEEKLNTETNLDTGYSSSNERVRIGGYGLGRQRWMENINKFLKWVQKDGKI